MTFVDTAIMLCVCSVMNYLGHRPFYGRKITLITDHQALGSLLKLKEPSAKLRWALRLLDFQYWVEHRFSGTEKQLLLFYTLR